MKHFVEDSIRQGRVVLKSSDESGNAYQSTTLLDAIAEFAFGACIGGARRDEEKSRAKERIFSFRDESDNGTRKISGLSYGVSIIHAPSGVNTSAFFP